MCGAKVEEEVEGGSLVSPLLQKEGVIILIPARGVIHTSEVRLHLECL